MMRTLRLCLVFAALLLLAPITASADSVAFLPYVQTSAIARARGPIVWATCLHVVDGDTIDVQLDGCPLEYVRVRLVGMDTPERGECYWYEARDRVRELEGQRVGLERDTKEWDSFGRLLRHVYGEDGRWLNGDLVAGGFARVMTVGDDDTYSERLQALEDDARAGSMGGWDACGW